MRFFLQIYGFYLILLTSQCSFCSQESCYVSNTFSTTTAGEYVFHATYQGENSDYQGQNSNEVTITAQ